MIKGLSSRPGYDHILVNGVNGHGAYTEISNVPQSISNGYYSVNLKHNKATTKHYCVIWVYIYTHSTPASQLSQSTSHAVMATKVRLVLFFASLTLGGLLGSGVQAQAGLSSN